MNSLREVTVPDIGDFKDIPVIEILVKPGDRAANDAPLVTLDSDKATHISLNAAWTVLQCRIRPQQDGWGNSFRLGSAALAILLLRHFQRRNSPRPVG
jgi:hypothetical protein